MFLLVCIHPIEILYLNTWLHIDAYHILLCCLWTHPFYLPSLSESFPLSNKSVGCALWDEEGAHWMGSPFILSLKTLTEPSLDPL